MRVHQHPQSLALQMRWILKIWEFAGSNGFTIVTFDEDFYNIQLLKGFPPKIIWFKTGNLSKKQFTSYLIAQKQMVEAFVNDAEAYAE